MRRGDGSLVFFTVLSQWSVGIAVCLAGLAVTDSFAMETGFRLANPVLLALLLIVAATTVSFLHLGNPVNAPKALKNLATSWLSREILGIGIYAFFLIAVLVSEWLPGGAAYRGYLLAACSVSGLFLVWAMARVYMIPTIPAWNSAFTLLGFLSTSLSLGLVTCLLFDVTGVFRLADGTDTVLSGLLAAVLVLEMGAGLVNQFRLARMETGIDGPSFGQGLLVRLFRVRLAVAFPACLLLVFFVFYPGLASTVATFASLFAVAALVALQEFAGRVLFYSSYFRIGM